jgi:excisionase family DNA binding protein
MTQPAEVPLLTREVARLLDVSTERVRQLAREGRIEAVRSAGGIRVYERSSVETYLRSRE